MQETRRKEKVVLSRKEKETNELRKEVKEKRNTKVSTKGMGEREVSYKRKERKKGLKELEVSVKRKKETTSREREKEGKKRRKTERKVRIQRIQERARKKAKGEERPRKKEEEVREWKEQVVRVGTGYRVRKDEKNPRKRRFDVGYADWKGYERKEGREANIEGSNMARTVVGKGKGCRIKVMNAVCDMEKRREVSDYTGSGILRKSLVGKLKRKPTKAGGKE